MFYCTIQYMPPSRPKRLFRATTVCPIFPGSNVCIKKLSTISEIQKDNTLPSTQPRNNKDAKKTRSCT